MSTNRNNISSIPFQRVLYNPYWEYRKAGAGFPALPTPKYNSKWYSFGNDGFMVDIKTNPACVAIRKDTEYVFPLTSGAYGEPVRDKAINADGTLSDCPGNNLFHLYFEHGTEVKYFIGTLGELPEGYTNNIAVINPVSGNRVFHKENTVDWFGEKVVGFIDAQEGDTDVYVQCPPLNTDIYIEGAPRVFRAYPKEDKTAMRLFIGAVRPGEGFVWLTNIDLEYNSLNSSLIEGENGLETICFNAPLDFYSWVGGANKKPPYRIMLTDGLNTWMTPDLKLCEGLLRVEWENLEDIETEEGVVIPARPADGEPLYKFMVYADATIAKPTYEYEEDVAKRDGRTYPIKQFIYKTFKFNFLAPEEVCDVFRLAGMADRMRVVDGKQIYNARTLSFDAEWQPQGYLANVAVEFTTNTVSKKIGRAYKE